MALAQTGLRCLQHSISFTSAQRTAVLPSSVRVSRSRHCRLVVSAKGNKSTGNDALDSELQPIWMSESPASHAYMLYACIGPPHGHTLSCQQIACSKPACMHASFCQTGMQELNGSSVDARHC